MVSLSNSFVQRSGGIDIDGSFGDGSFGPGFLAGGGSVEGVSLCFQHRILLVSYTRKVRLGSHYYGK